MKKSCFLLGLVMVIQFFLLITCNNDKKDSKIVTITDMAGDIVKVPKNPEKLAVLARSAVDMLVAFGLGEKVTGIYYTIFDNEWASILYPNIDSYHKYDYDTTLETYLTHNVELVFCPEQYLAENLREHGIPSCNSQSIRKPKL
jgi:ABC-type Fe3+-hydroxamate transport system substrate-binding protein